MRILVVEDDLTLADLLRNNLRTQSYSVDTAASGEEGESLIEFISYDLMILDVGLPGKDGLEVCRDLRQKHKPIPILMLSAHSTQEDKVLGFESGADDYLTKPFAFRELFARVTALLRRQTDPKYTHLQIGKFTLDLTTMCFTFGNKKIELTPRECMLMEYFMYNPGQVLTRTEICQYIGDDESLKSGLILETLIASILAKAGGNDKDSIIQSVKGVGYLFKAGMNYK